MESLGGTITVIVVIVLSAGLMIVFPLMTTADRADDVTQQILDTEVSKLVDEVCTSGELTQERFDKFIESVNSTGYAYVPEMEVKVLDENPGKKTTQAKADKIGENQYYSKYQVQLEEELELNKKITLKEGDFFYLYVVNPNPTLATELKNFFSPSSGNDTYSAVASDSGMVTKTGK